MRHVLRHKKTMNGCVPLVSFDEAAQGLSFINNLRTNTQCAMIEVPNWHSDLFALLIADNALAPRFYPGYVAIIDSTCSPVNDDYVLVYFPEQQRCLLRRLTLHDHQQILLAHNPNESSINLSEKKPEEYVIQGVVVNTIMQPASVGKVCHETASAVIQQILQ